MAGPTKVVVVSLEPDVIDLVTTSGDYQAIGFLDRPGVSDPLIANLGEDAAWPELARQHPDLKVVLAIDPPRARRRLAELFGLKNLQTVISGDAFVSPVAALGPGSIVQRAAHVGRNSQLGPCVKVNVGAHIHHDCQVGAFTTVAPGARLLGRVCVGGGCYIGAEAVILPKVRIGAEVMIGAGAVVTTDLPDGARVRGVPARRAATQTNPRRGVE